MQEPVSSSFYILLVQGINGAQVSFAEMDWSKSNNGIGTTIAHDQDPKSSSSRSSLIEDDLHCPLTPLHPDTIEVRLERKATSASNRTVIGPSPSIPPVPNPALLQVPPSLPGSRRGSADTVATEGSIQWATDTDISYSETEDEGEPAPMNTQNKSSMDLCATTPASEKSYLEVGLGRSKTVIDRRNTVRQRGGGSGSNNGGGGKGNSSTSRHPVESNYRISRTHQRGNSGGSPGGGGGDDDDLNDDRRKRQRKDDDSQRRGSEADYRRFACPYYRFDPTNSDHMRCREKSFPTLARVKYVLHHLEVL